MPKAPTTLPSAKVRRASTRPQEAEVVAEAVPSGGPSVGQQAHVLRAVPHYQPGERQEDHYRHRTGCRRRCRKAGLSDAQQEDRSTDHAAEARPQRRQRHRAAIKRLEPGRERRGDRGHGKAGPTHPHHQKSRVDLPWLICLPDPGHTGGQGERSQRDCWPRAKAVDRGAHQDQQERADHIEQRDRARHQTG